MELVGQRPRPLERRREGGFGSLVEEQGGKREVVEEFVRQELGALGDGRRLLVHGDRRPPFAARRQPTPVDLVRVQLDIRASERGE